MDRAELESLAAALDTLHRRRQSDRIAGRLIDFVRLCWHVVEPAREFVGGWHLDAMGEHLQAVTAGEITRLLMNVPPGAMKSLLTDVFWPAWCWGPCNMPEHRFIAASYSAALTERDNLRFGRLISSQVYQENWGELFGLTAQAAVKVTNDRTGWKLATSVGGLGTGERGDVFLVDDAHNIKDGESEAKRESTLQWWREVVPTRMNDPDKSAIVVIMQRVHEGDIAGDIIRNMREHDADWTHLMIPQRYDARRHCQTAWFDDPRAEDGELYWPERFPEHVVVRDEAAIGDYAVAAQFQQEPVPRGGGIFKRDWFRVYPEEGEEFDDAGKPVKPLQYPPFEYLCASVDTAYGTKKENDWSAASVWGVWRDSRSHVSRLMLVEAWHARIELHDLVVKVIDTCTRYRVDALLLEAKASGMSVMQEIARLSSGRDWTVIPINPETDKIARAYSVQGFVQSGVVSAPDRAWADLLIDEMCSMPRGAHDDLADTATQAMNYMRRAGILQMTDESAAEYADSIMWKPSAPSIATAYEDE